MNQLHRTAIPPRRSGHPATPPPTPAPPPSRPPAAATHAPTGACADQQLPDRADRGRRRPHGGDDLHHPERARRRHQLPGRPPAPVAGRGTAPRRHRRRPADGRRRNRPDHPAAADHATRPAQATRQLNKPPRPRPATPGSITKEPATSIIAWIVLGLGAGLLANMAIPGRRSQGLILTCVVGIAGALAGGWVAATMFHLHHPLQGFFNASTS